MFKQLLIISKQGDFMTSLGNLCQCFVTWRVKKHFLMFRQPLVFQCVPTAFCISAFKHLSKDLKVLHIHCSYGFHLDFMRPGHCNDTVCKDIWPNSVFLPLRWFLVFMANLLDCQFILKRSSHLNSSHYSCFFLPTSSDANTTNTCIVS